MLFFIEIAIFTVYYKTANSLNRERNCLNVKNKSPFGDKSSRLGGNKIRGRFRIPNTNWKSTKRKQVIIFAPFLRWN